MGGFEVFKKTVQRGSYWMAGIGMFFAIPLMLLTTADVVGRDLFSKPVAGTLEVSEYMLAVLILLGAAYTQQVKGHVCVDFFTGRFSRKTRVYFDTFTTILSLFIVTVLVWQGFVLGIQETAVTDQLRIPKAPFKMLVGIGGTLLWLQLLIDLADNIAKIRRKTH